MGIELASRAWKARPGGPFTADARPMAQLSDRLDRPLLSVGDRQEPLLRARGGHGRRGPTALQRNGDGHKLNRRARPGHDDHLPCWQESQGARGRSGIRLVSVDRKVACAVHPASEPRHPLVVAIQVAWVQRQHRSGHRVIRPFA
jgi:hypothetical protein